MGKSNDVALAQILEEAQARGACLAPSSRRVREALRRRVRAGRGVIEPERGIYAQAEYWDALPRPERSRHAMRALQELHPDWVFCAESAAAAWGLPVAYASLGTLHIATSPDRRRSRYGNTVWHVVEGDCVEQVHGIRATSLSRTVYDCLRRAHFGQGLAVADGALRLGGASPERFIRYFHRMGRAHRGTWRAIGTMRYADPRSESGGESIARAAMIEQGFALPELQVSLPRPLDRERSFRVDFLWTRGDGSHVIGEFDGMQKYEDASLRGGRTSVQVLADEQHREAQLSLYGMPIVRLSYRDVVDPARLGRILDLYRIPRSDEAVRCRGLIERSRLGAAVVYKVLPLRWQS